MASMKLKAGAFRYGVGTGSSSMVGSRGGMQHGGHGGGGGNGGGGGQVMGLRALSGNGEGDVPGRSSGGIGKRYGAGSRFSSANRYRGLGAEAPETILTTADPVGMYVKALQTMFAENPEIKNVSVTGRWDFVTHQAMIEWLGGIYGVEDKSRFPGWREDPGFTAFFAIEMFLGGFDLSSAFAQMAPFYAALGLPTTSMRDAIQAVTNQESATRMRQIFDRVTRYIIGCEGGKVYGDPMTQYKGIGSAIADVVLGIGLVALL